jgi:uncharacterized phage protein (TIGR01671 family)
MNREIKFRVWSFNERIFHYFDVYEGCSGLAGAWSEPQQFTGLKDSNGKEIYEGDILSTYYECHKSESEAYGFSVIKWGRTGWVYNQDRKPSDYFLGNSEVIGNIFENPDLLK